MGVFQRMALLGRTDLRVLLGVFRKTAMTAAQRVLFRLKLPTAVPMSAFGGSCLYGWRTSITSFEDLPIIRSWEDLCNFDEKRFSTLTPVEYLQKGLNAAQMQKLLHPDEVSSAPDFYEAILKEAGIMGEEKVVWRGCTCRCCRVHYLGERRYVLLRYLEYIRECTGLSAEFQQRIMEDLQRKIKNADAALRDARCSC